MSTTYDIRCDKCRVHYWCGQSSLGVENGYLYDTKKLYAFLTQHAGHSLVYDHSEFLPSGYSQIEPEPHEAAAQLPIIQLVDDGPEGIAIEWGEWNAVTANAMAMAAACGQRFKLVPE